MLSLRHRATPRLYRVRSQGVGTKRQILTARLNRRLSTGYGDETIPRPQSARSAVNPLEALARLIHTAFPREKRALNNPTSRGVYERVRP